MVKHFGILLLYLARSYRKIGSVSQGGNGAKTFRKDHSRERKTIRDNKSQLNFGQGRRLMCTKKSALQESFLTLLRTRFYKISRVPKLVGVGSGMY